MSVAIEDIRKMMEERMVDPSKNKRYYAERGIDTIILGKIIEFMDVLETTMKETYLDNIETQEEIQGHFSWCVNKAATQHAELNEGYEVDELGIIDFTRFLLNTYEYTFYDENVNRSIFSVKDFYMLTFDIKSTKDIKEFDEIEEIQRIYIQTFTL